MRRARWHWVRQPRACQEGRRDSEERQKRWPGRPWGQLGRRRRVQLQRRRQPALQHHAAAAAASTPARYLDYRLRTTLPIPRFIINCHFYFVTSFFLVRSEHTHWNQNCCSMSMSTPRRCSLTSRTPLRECTRSARPARHWDGAPSKGGVPPSPPPPTHKLIPRLFHIIDLFLGGTMDSVVKRCYTLRRDFMDRFGMAGHKLRFCRHWISGGVDGEYERVEISFMGWS